MISLTTLAKLQVHSATRQLRIFPATMRQITNARAARLNARSNIRSKCAVRTERSIGHSIAHALAHTVQSIWFTESGPNLDEVMERLLVPVDNPHSHNPHSHRSEGLNAGRACS